MAVPILLALLALAHGGQYLPPPPDPEVSAEGGAGAPFTLPGSGPTLSFEAGRWEWWFDFNQERIVGTRARQRAVAARPGSEGLQPVTHEDRVRLLVPPLVHALRNGQRDVRAAACMALARLGEPATLPFLEVALEDNDLFVRTHAVLALGVSGLGAAVEPLARLLADAELSAEERSFAAAALGLLGTPEAVQLLVARTAPKRLARSGNQLQAALVYALGLTNSPAAVSALEALVDSRLGRSEAGLLALAGVALGQLGRPEGLAPLLRLLAHDDNQVRRSAASGLLGLARWLTDEDVGELLEQFGRESDMTTRAHLLHALGLVRSERSRRFLEGFLERAPALLRPHAALAMGLDGDASLAGPLLEVLSDQHEVSVRSALLVALGLVGTPEVDEPLAQQAERARDPALAGYAALAIGLTGRADDERISALEDWAGTSPDVELIRLSTQALGLLGRQASLLALADSLGDVRGTLYRAARLHALGLVGDRRLLESLVGVVTDEYQPSFVRAYAIEALGALGDARDISPLARLSQLVELNHEIGFVFEFYQLY